MPSIDKHFPTADNLHLFENMADLIKDNKFLNLYDSKLHVIIGIRDAEIINFEKTRKALKYDELFAAMCKIGWTVCGPDQYRKK